MIADMACFERILIFLMLFWIIMEILKERTENIIGY